MRTWPSSWNRAAYIQCMQVLQQAQQIDQKHAQGQDIRPLCGLVYVIKDL